MVDGKSRVPIRNHLLGNNNPPLRHEMSGSAARNEGGLLLASVQITPPPLTFLRERKIGRIFGALRAPDFGYFTCFEVKSLKPFREGKGGYD